jgi:hypothetical protein
MCELGGVACVGAIRLGLGGGLAAELCAAQECGEGVDAGDEECEEEENGGGEEKGEGGFGHGVILPLENVSLSGAVVIAKRRL